MGILMLSAFAVFCLRGDGRQTLGVTGGMRLLFIGALRPLGFIINIKTSFDSLR